MTPTTCWVASDPGSPKRTWKVGSGSSRTTWPLESRRRGSSASYARIAERSYGVRFEDDTPLSERVLLPAMSAESKGMEDARFVRFSDDDASVTYYASYTAYNGTDIGQQLLETKDFSNFTSSPMVGAPQPTRVWLSSPAGSVAGSPPSLELIGNRTRSPIRTNPYVAGKNGWHARRRRHPGRSCNSATAGRPSRPKQAGWCSPTASAPCAPTTSGPFCSTSKTPLGSSVGSASRSSARSRRAGRLRAQRRLLLRCPPPCGHPGHSLRNRRLRHRRGDRASGRTSRCPRIPSPIDPYSHDTYDWRTPCLTDPLRSHPERSPASP